ncbi:hypothetical protein D3X12_14905 [Pseudomonas protegens]|nr:hypothetical protein CEP86_32380 [Pseudomonas protegens]QEZ51908.1 hypothetical protein D3X12_14905 [Pseudomonas protegens]QEZ56022.1 hypothetical protein D4N38_04570 [Pseudomonas protegens]QEZ63168.1 hypothetical protein D4N37_10230 [Pseudomonas protegens]
MELVAATLQGWMANQVERRCYLISQYRWTTPRASFSAVAAVAVVLTRPREMLVPVVVPVGQEEAGAPVFKRPPCRLFLRKTAQMTSVVPVVASRVTGHSAVPVARRAYQVQPEQLRAVRLVVRWLQMVSPWCSLPVMMLHG